MLLSEKLLQSVLPQMKVADILDSLLFQWNYKQKCFQLKKGRKQHVFQYKFFSSLLFGLLVFLQTLCTWNNANIFAKINSIYFMSALLTFCCFHTVLRSKARKIVSYLNAMLLFENRRKGNYFNKTILIEYITLKYSFYKVVLGILTIIMRNSLKL